MPVLWGIVACAWIPVAGMSEIAPMLRDLFEYRVFDFRYGGFRVKL